MCCLMLLVNELDDMLCIYIDVCVTFMLCIYIYSYVMYIYSLTTYL
jgi:hypothetical protein